MGIWELLVLLCWVPVIITVHEAGHALSARAGGFRLTSFGIGRGTPLLVHRGHAGATIYLGRWVLAGGASVAIPRGLEPGPRAALYHGGGVAAQTLLALALVALPAQWWWVGPVARFNALVLLWNLAPWRVAGATSDGWRVLESLAPARLLSWPLYASRGALRRLLAFEAGAQSPLGAWYCRLLLAWADVLVGRPDIPFFAEEHPESALDPALDALQQHVTAAWLRSKGRPQEALRVLHEIRAAYEGSGSLPLHAVDLLAVQEARAHLDLGAPEAADGVLARLAGVGGRIGNEARVIALEAALAVSSPPEVVRACVERLPGHLPGLLDPPAAVRALWQAAGVLDDDDLRRRAQRTAARLLAAAEADDRAPLLRRMGAVAGLREPAEAAEP